MSCKHNWKSPQSVFGELATTPAHGPGYVISDEVCCKCGQYRQTLVDHHPSGCHIENLKTPTYRPADKVSLAYVARRAAKEAIKT